VVIPATAREPLVMNRAFQRRSGASESSLVCVPILLDRKPGGRHRRGLPFNANRDYQSDAQFLAVVASMVPAPARAAHVETERTACWPRTSTSGQELEQRYDFSNIVGTSGPIAPGLRADRAGAQTNTTVMIRERSRAPARS